MIDELDIDSPEWTDADFRVARPTVEVFPQLLQRGRGPQHAPTKVSTTLRLDRDLVDFFRTSGPGWQTRLNQALREWVSQHTDAVA